MVLQSPGYMSCGADPETMTNVFYSPVFLCWVFRLSAAEQNTEHACRYLGVSVYGSFRKLGVPYFGVIIIRILLCRVLY